MIYTSVAIAGMSSEVGKTTLMCELLTEFPGWEAIKITRGHYRSCGKDPHACCVSHLLSEEPLIKSGFLHTYASDKDTGRYWDAGAANVHWVIATDDQVRSGIEQALERVKSNGVLIEGNSFLQFINVDYTVLVGRFAEKSPARSIKNSTRWAYQKAAAFYHFDDLTSSQADMGRELSKRFPQVTVKRQIPTFSRKTLSQLVSGINQIHLNRMQSTEAMGFLCHCI